MVFLDIEMPHLDGMSAARKIREKDASLAIIFLTYMAQYAIHGYEVNAVDFIVKPVGYFVFADKLRKALNFMRLNAQRGFVLQTDEAMVRVTTPQIVYIEKEKNYLIYHTRSGDYRVRGTMAAVEGELRGRGPVRLLLALPGYFLACALAFQIFSRVLGDSPVTYILYYAALFAVSLAAMRVCFAVKWSEILFAGVCGYATQYIAFAAITVVNQLTGLSLPPVGDFFVVRLLPYMLISAGVWFFVIRKNAGKGTVQDRDIRMVVLALAVLFTVVFISVLVDNRVFRENSALLQNVFCKLYAVVCCLLAIFVAYFMSRQNQILRENEIMEGMLRQSEEKQKLSQETINIINIKCHDLKYRLSHLPAVDNGQKEYIKSVSDALAIYDNTFQTGSDALDLVLTEKSLLCSQYHIKFSYMADGAALAGLSSPDLYALFGNLMNNAIESVLKEPDEDKRIISLTIQRKGAGSHVHMDNHCGEAVSFEDGLPLTTKADKASRGFGVRSIRYIVEKYHGDLLMRAEKDRFLVDILLPNVT